MHPAVGFLYLLGVMGITAFAGSPVVVLESLGRAALLAALSGRLRGIGWTVPIAFTAALANFLFVHNGATALFFVGDMAFTLEALAYGAFTGVMLSSVCLWGNNAVRYVTSDKYIWLFGRILPAAGLVLSCAIRFIPMFVRRTREFIAVQRCTTVRGYLRAFSASVGYSAEPGDGFRAVNARPGLRHRTAHQLFAVPLHRRDRRRACCDGIPGRSVRRADDLRRRGVLVYPAVSGIRMRLPDILLYCVSGVFFLLPSAVVLWENVQYARGLGLNSARAKEK